jgi:hypothetical protein
MNCCVVTTFTETVAGEIVTLMFVTGSVQVEVEVVAEDVVVLVVQVTAVLAGAAPQEDKPKRAATNARNRRRFTATLCLLFEIPNSYDFGPTMILKIGNYSLLSAGLSTRLEALPSTGAYMKSFPPPRPIRNSASFQFQEPAMALELIVDRANRRARCIRIQHVELCRAHQIQHKILRRNDGIRGERQSAAESTRLIWLRGQINRNPHLRCPKTIDVNRTSGHVSLAVACKLAEKVFLVARCRWTWGIGPGKIEGITAAQGVVCVRPALRLPE